MSLPCRADPTTPLRAPQARGSHTTRRPASCERPCRLACRPRGGAGRPVPRRRPPDGAVSPSRRAHNPSPLASGSAPRCDGGERSGPESGPEPAVGALHPVVLVLVGRQGAPVEREGQPRHPGRVTGHCRASEPGDGRSKLVEQCTYPLTGRRCVSRVSLRDHAIVDLAPREVRVRSTPGISLEELRSRAGSTDSRTDLMVKGLLYDS